MNQALRIWHPVTHSKMDLPPLQVERAEGVYLYTKDGEKILDAISSWWVNLHGHANPRIAAAIAEQACRLEHVILAGFGAAFEKVVAGGGGVVLRVACVLQIKKSRAEARPLQMRWAQQAAPVQVSL